MKYVQLKKLITVFGVTLVLALPVVALAAVASSSNYQLERDSINIGGLLSTTTNYTLEDTAGELVSGTSSSASYFLKAGYQQMDASFITITSPVDATLSPSISEASGGTADGNATWTVTTDSSSGYTLSIKSSTAPAMQSGGASFDDYTVGAAPHYSWSVGNTEKKFGYTPEGGHIVARYLDNGSNCDVAGGSETSLVCWDGLSTTNRVIASSATQNSPSGTATRVRFRAEAGSGSFPDAGSYVATVVVTAITQ